ncbi:MAG TPA: fumarylacetoacetase [Actinoplanes sp.]|nr:fumarylacetoacetase [Actinoplanes sp.]
MTWLEGDDPGFGVNHLPYGVFSTGTAQPRVGVRVHGHVLDLAPALQEPAFAVPHLNAFLAGGRAYWDRIRERITDLLTTAAQADAVRPFLHPLTDVALHLPVAVADYVDFYASLEHASNLGRMFRPDEEPLKPNWRHLPVGYHGRSGSVVVSGTPIPRPSGQMPGGAAFAPTGKLDIEAELGFVVGAPSAPNTPVPPAAFAEHVFGVVLLNDWSARDIQAWEYVPLGPFLGKSFGTSIAAWVTPLAALESARVPGRRQDPEPLPHLARAQDWGLDLALEVWLNAERISRPPYAGMYWTPDQMLAHLTSNGAAVRTGDLFGSGTVSGPTPETRGSLIELTWNGAEPLRLADGSTRTFLADGDTVTLTASAPGPGGEQIRLAPVDGRIVTGR